jgi:hypothetical protein
MIGDMQDKNKSKVNEQAKTRGEIFCDKKSIDFLLCCSPFANVVVLSFGNE